MKKTDYLYKHYVEILEKELFPAMGCTEPVALAYAAAKACEVLGQKPEKLLVEISGNIVKNVKSVVVPNTGGRKGIKASVAIGVIASNSEKKLELLEGITDEQRRLLGEFLNNVPIEIKMADTERSLEIIVTVFAGESSARIKIIDAHTNIVLIEKDGKVLLDNEHDLSSESDNNYKLDVESIIEFADSVDVDDVRALLERQIDLNTAISNEGLKNNYGANIGTILLQNFGDDIKVRAKAAAAAGSDARMSGCDMPVIIIAGSGNQGLTASLPVIEYAKHLNSSQDDLIRALIVSDLITIHMKNAIGRLSAYCGVVCAGAAAGAGIAYLQGGRLDEIAHTLVNALAITSGIICDGAKPSCAAKIAASVDAGILGYEMYENGQQFYGGDGIVSKGVENTINNISRLSTEGMRETDKKIIQIMLADE